MNKAFLLLDERYIIKRYGKKILKKFPQFDTLQKIEIIPHKKHIWESTYHIVFEYLCYFKNKKGEKKVYPVFCSAHNSEPRKNVYESLKFLWHHGFGDFNKNNLLVPRPLFYSKFFRGVFYQGVIGKNLYHYIKNNDKQKIEMVVKKTAAWFARLHKLPIEEAHNFNRDNSRIQTVKPGMTQLFKRISFEFPEYYKRFKMAYELVNFEEKNFLKSQKKLWLVHGDAHPENIIRINSHQIAVIDFTDFSLTDFARDLGTFTQQIDFKIMRRIGDQEYANKIKEVFLNNYFKNVKIKLNTNLQKRINIYYNWTALRTAAFFLMGQYRKIDRAEKLLNEVCKNLKIC